jgi:putative glutamine amidotransferase
MLKKVLVVLPYKLDEGDKFQNIHFIYQTYLSQLINLNLLPLLLPSLCTEEMAQELYGQADGVMLVGGADINPEIYREDKQPLTKVTNALRDEMETAIVKMVVQDKKPLLGICRGMQIVNAVLGGSLYQHTPDVTAENHYVVSSNADTPPTYEDVASDRDQYMLVQERTKLDRIVKDRKLSVRCAHHQSINKVGEGLIVNAKSEGGTIEGLESTDNNHFIMLLQNHIETQNDEFSGAIFKRFAAELK